MNSNKAKRIQKLARDIYNAKIAYYTTDKPIISDREYDTLEQRLKAECQNHPILQMVGYDIHNTFKNPGIKQIEELLKETENAS